MITEERVSFKVVEKVDKEYEEAILNFNRAIDSKPDKIFFCKCEEEVIDAIKWCRENDREFRIRSGRHHYEGYSTGEGLIVIDISLLNKVEFNEEEETVTLEGGFRNREAYSFINGKGYLFPGGGCPTVGVAGFTLGGGWGYYGRLLGLGCDNLIEASMIDYKGDKILINKNENNDLFWAIKGGGGGNFGVITKMTFSLKEKLSHGTLISIEYENISKEENIKLINIWQELFKNLDSRMNMKMANYNSSEKGRGVKITGVFCGEKALCEEILKPLKGVNCKINMELDYLKIEECNKIIQDNHPEYESYKSGGRFLERDLSLKEIEKLLSLFDNPALGSTYSAISFYGMGGKIKEVKNSETAFAFRECNFIIGVQSVWEKEIYKEQNVLWIEEVFSKVSSLTKGSFINFPINQGENYEEAYYGENIKRLKAIKGKYDPLNIFKFPQSIKK